MINKNVKLQMLISIILVLLVIAVGAISRNILGNPFHVIVSVLVIYNFISMNIISVRRSGLKSYLSKVGFMIGAATIFFYTMSLVSSGVLHEFWAYVVVVLLACSFLLNSFNYFRTILSNRTDC